MTPPKDKDQATATDETRDASTAAASDGVATAEQNAALEHSRGGTTTRQDGMDAGVPMLPGHPDEPVGPEDALGVGPKRGDYRDRLVGQSHEGRAVAGGGQPIYRSSETGEVVDADDENAVLVDYTPTQTLVAQNPRAEDIGDATALKGGVETDPEAPLAAGARARAARAAETA